MTPTRDGATPHDHRGHVAGPAPRLQWVGLLLAPAVFFAHLQGAYLLVLADCGTDGGKWAVHGAGFLALLIAVAGLWAAWVSWQRAGVAAPGDDGGPTPRTRLVAASGLGLSGVLSLILLAQLVAGFIVPRCQ